MKNKMTSLFILLPLIFAFGQNSNNKTVPSKWYMYETAKYDIYFTQPDSSDMSRYLAYFDNAHETIEKFFGAGFLTKFDVYIHPDKKSLDLQWSADWNMPGFKSECWMIGSGVANQFDLLSTRAWKKEACEHNPDDINDIQKFITHEMVHTYHGQVNLNHFFEGMEDMSWFLEGVAVVAAGELKESGLEAVKQLVREDRYPRILNKFWEGDLRYALCGSIVNYVSTKYGADKLKELLKARSNQELLQKLGVHEKQLINDWAEDLINN